MYRWEVTHNDVPEHMFRGVIAVDLFFNHVAHELKDQLADTSPRDKNELAENWEVARQGANDYVVETNVLHAPLVRYGTGVYIGRDRLKPKEAGALVFFWKKMGRTVAFKGDLYNDRAQAGFYEWATARDIEPWFTWPKGQPAQDFVTPAMVATEYRLYPLMEQAFHTARAAE